MQTVSATNAIENLDVVAGGGFVGRACGPKEMSMQVD